MLAALALTFLTCVGCETSSPAELATLEQMTPSELEVGEQLTLQGSGFIVGPASLVLEGTLSAPGQTLDELDTTMTLPVLATSPTTATARLGRRHLERTEAGHMTFSGSATLRFASAAGPDAPPVVATLHPVRLELFTGPSSHQRGAHHVQIQGRAVLDTLGITGTPLPESRGVLIERLRSGSLGARAGLQPGEVIVAAGNVTVATIADLAPPPHTETVALSVRDVNGRIRRVPCSLAQHDMLPDLDRIAALAIAGGALLFIVLIAGPLRGPFDWLGRRLVHSGTGPLDILRQLTDSGRDRPLMSFVSMLLFASAPFLVMAVAHFGAVVIVGLIVLAAAIAGLTSAVGWRRFVATITTPLRTIPLIMAAVLGSVRGASMDLNDIVNAQGPLPWQWNMLSDPACLLLLVVICATTCAGGPARPGTGSALLRGLAGAFTAALLLGGWSFSVEQDLWGQILFAVKAWSLGLCMIHGGRVNVVSAIILSSGLAAASLALNLLPLPSWAPAALPWAAASLAVFVVIPLALRAVLGLSSGPQVSQPTPTSTGTLVTHGSRKPPPRVAPFETAPGHP